MELFKENWNFLTGGHIIYEWVYNKSNESYLGLSILFYTLNFELWIIFSSLLSLLISLPFIGKDTS